MKRTFRSRFRVARRAKDARSTLGPDRPQRSRFDAGAVLPRLSVRLEFCDIVVMNGRVPRTKLQAQLVRELEALRLAGWKDMIFIVDDNFIGNRKHAKELLRAFIDWRHRMRPTMGFFTDSSVNFADYAELCELMVEAGFNHVLGQSSHLTDSSQVHVGHCSRAISP